MPPSSAPPVRIRRVYDAPAADDGRRVLVDRLWPRGFTRERVAAEWLPAVAPSRALRIWYDHRAERWSEFRRRYRAELDAGEAADALARLRALAREGTVTLLTATRETARSHAVALAAFLGSPSPASRAPGGGAAGRTGTARRRESRAPSR